METERERKNMNRTEDRRLNRYVVQKETESELLLFVVETRESLYDYVEHILLHGFCLDAPLARLRKGTDEAMLSRITQTNLGKAHGGEDGGVDGYVELSAHSSATVCLGDWLHGHHSYWYCDGTTADVIEEF